MTVRFDWQFFHNKLTIFERVFRWKHSGRLRDLPTLGSIFKLFFYIAVQREQKNTTSSICGPRLTTALKSKLWWEQHVWALGKFFKKCDKSNCLDDAVASQEGNRLGRLSSKQLAPQLHTTSATQWWCVSNFHVCMKREICIFLPSISM